MGIQMGGMGSSERRPTVFMHGRGPDEGEKWLEDVYNDNYAHVSAMMANRTESHYLIACNLAITSWARTSILGHTSL